MMAQKAPSPKKAPHGFYRFTEAVIQDIDMFKTKEEFHEFAFSPMSNIEKQEFINFVGAYNAGLVTDDDMQKFWGNSHADFYIPDSEDLRRFLTEAAERARRPFHRKSGRSGFERR